jgi:Peptidase family M48
LAGPGWYQAVSEILTTQCDTEEPQTIIPPDDWRYTWVQSTLRRLESGIPVLQDEYSLVPNWLDVGPDEIPLPPPAEYPLRPRPRASDYLRMFSNMTCGKVTQHSAHVTTGPPYSLLIVDRPDASNAFSYGFGPNGGGGIVVFSGFLDEIIKNTPPSDRTLPQTRSEEVSWWSYIFGSISPISSRHSHIIPTPEQTDQLAILLAHELSHLVLSHHLESLSAGSVIIPGVVSIVTDLVRALLFPITMLFGPFVNDAVANMGKVGSGEVLKLTMLCSSRKQEIEADVVSTRFVISDFSKTLPF